MCQTTNRSSLRPKTLMSRQHSLISFVVVAWDSRSLLSKMIWIKTNNGFSSADLASGEGPQCRDLTSLALAKKSTGFSAFRKAVTVKLWKSVRSPSVYPSAWNKMAAAHQTFVFEKQEWECLTALASSVWLTSVFETIKQQTCIPLVSWRGSALSPFWPGRPPPWKHV